MSFGIDTLNNIDNKNIWYLLYWWARAELAQAEGFLAQLGSAPDLFTSVRNWKLTEKWAEISILSWRPIFYYFLWKKLTKSCIYIKLFTFKNTKTQINDHEIDQNDDTGLLMIKTCGKNELKNFRFSSVSAQKLKCPSSARLGTFIARLGSSREIPAWAHH